MYQVIARKWRPQTFEEVTGQEPITRTLSNAVEHERLHHAYIFSGARGVGKTSTARLFAKALNCHKSNKPTPKPCRMDDDDMCPSCREIAEGRSIDVQEIDAASTTGVQNVRDSIIDTIGISPARDRYKVFIIDEVHMLSPQAFNALLKTLEEPPPRVVFIMATTEGHKLLDTIVSRCQYFEFRTIATAKNAERLRFIAKEEKINITDDALREIARAGEGSMRDAQSALDQIISFSGAEIKTDDVEAALGIAGSDVLGRVMDAIAEEDFTSVLTIVDDLVLRGHDLRNFCRDLMAHTRDLLVTKAAGETAEILELSESEKHELERQASSFTESDLIRFFHSLTATEHTLRDAAHPRYQLEVGLVKLIEMRRLVPIQQIIDRISSLEKSLQSGGQSSPSPSPQSSTGGGHIPAGSRKASQSQGATRTSPANRASSIDIAARVSTDEGFEIDDKLFEGLGGLVPPVPDSDEPELSANASAVNENATRPAASTKKSSSLVDEGDTDALGVAGSMIDSIKSALEKRRRMFLVTALDAALRVDFEGAELSVEFAADNKHLRDNLAKPDNVKILREVCSELLGQDIAVRIITRERDADTDNGPMSKEDEERLDKKRIREYAEQHPAVQQLLKTFHGEIVDVRRVDSETPASVQKPE